MVRRPWRLQTPAHAAGGHLDAFQDQFLGHAQATVAGVLQAVIEDRLLDLRRHPVGVWAFGARQAVDQAVRPIGLIVAPDLVELLPAITHDPARPGDVAQLARQL